MDQNMDSRDCQPNVSDAKNCVDSMAGSVQSHLSTTNSQQRLRASASCSQNIHKRDPTPLEHRERFSSFTVFLRGVLFSAPILPQPISNRPLHSRPWSTLGLKWAFSTYCLLSLAIFSVTLYKHFRGERHIISARVSQYPTGSSLSAFEEISTAQRLARISSLQPPFVAFEPYLIHPSEDPEDPVAVTACIWSHELEDFDVLYSWASMWRGPISLLMTTTAAPKSDAHVVLLKRTHGLKTPISIPGLSLHLLHLTHQDQGSPNTFLNIARLFASTKTVMLVPANISVLPLIASDVANREFRLRSLPLIVTSAANWTTFFTLPSLSPLIIHLDYPVWCTDRFFLDNTRPLDWTECLWQFWLDTFGEFSNVQATIRTRGQQTYVSDTNTESTIRKRLSARFRSEVCDVVARTMATLGPKSYTGWKKKLLWLKHTCGQQSVERMFRNT